MSTVSTSTRPPSTRSVPSQHVWWLRPKYLLFAFIVLMVAYVLVHNEYFLVDPKAPVWEHYQPFKWWLLPHGLAAACALLLGPLQFPGANGRNAVLFHRPGGRHPVDDHHRHHLRRHSQRKSPAAPPVDDPQLCGCSGLSRSARDRGCDRLEESWRRSHRNHRMGLPGLLPASRSHRPAVAGTAPRPADCGGKPLITWPPEGFSSRWMHLTHHVGTSFRRGKP
jgi:hypothetical protein